MTLLAKIEVQKLLEEHVQDQYQRYHALMVATAMEGYAKTLGEDEGLWYITGLLHDIDFEKYPEAHPRESLGWFKEWGYPEDLSHAIEAHAYGFNGFTTLPQSKLAAGLMACGEMKVSSIKKRLAEKSFAAKIDRQTVYRGCESLGVSVDEHIANLIKFFAVLV